MRTLIPLLLLAACSADESSGELQGMVYEMSPSALTIEGADSGAADLVRGALPPILLQAATADDSSVVWRLAIATGSPPVQDSCAQTIDLPSATRTETGFEVSASSLTVEGEMPWTLTDMSSSGTISEDLATVTDITLNGTIDTRELVGLIPLLSSGEAICTAFSGFGLDCEDCGGGENFCVTLNQSGFTAASVDATVEAITTDPLCE